MTRAGLAGAMGALVPLPRRRSARKEGALPPSALTRGLPRGISGKKKRKGAAR